MLTGLEGAVMSQDAGRLAHLLGWCGIALMAAGGLMVVATLLHPSRETATTIVASEWRLVAAHFVHACLVGAARPSRTLCRSPAAGWDDLALSASSPLSSALI
jgi:hypothetical protein